VTEKLADTAGQSIIDALNALRAAEALQRKRVTDRTGLGDNDLAALQLVVTASRSGAGAGPKEISQTLKITSASTTVLLDRLEKKNLVRRATSPFDRRALLVLPTDTGTAVSASVDATIAARTVVANGVEPADAAIITGFLNRLTDAVQSAENSSN
jgi:DNA-binding MarR family transcriptional regulator